MLRKINCVMIYVKDLTEAVNFYADVFGLKPVWQDQNQGQAGMLLQEGDAEVILHTDPNIPGQVEIYYQVDDVSATIAKFVDQGCTLLAEPFEMRMGRGAVIQDPFGVRFCLRDMSRATIESDQF